MQVVIESPTNNWPVINEVMVKVEVKTIFELTAVTARMAGKDYPLSPNRCMLARNNQCVLGYESTISTANLLYGTYQIQITARDVYGTTASAQVSIIVNRPPRLTMISPRYNEISQSGKIRLEVDCEDDDPDPCGAASIEFEADGSNSITTIRSNSSGFRVPVNAEIPIDQLNGKSGLLCVKISDGNGSGIACTRLHIEMSPLLRQVNSFMGTIIDMKDDRILINERPDGWQSSTRLVLFRRSTGTKDVIFPDVRVSESRVPPNASCTYLTDNGVVFPTDGTSKGLLRLWENGKVTTIGQIAGACSVKGNYVSWFGTDLNGTSTTPNGMMLHDITRGITTRIAENTSIWQFSTGANGSVAYWLNKEVYRYADGKSTLISNPNDGGGTEPVTDGTGVVFKGNGLRLWTAKGEGSISPYAPFNLNRLYIYYMVENGRVAFPREGASGGSQVWIREMATGVEKQLHYVLAYSYPDSLSAGGRVSYILLSKLPLIPESKRYVSAGGVPEEVGSTLGTPFWVDERLYIAIAGTLFQFTGDLSNDLPSPVPTITSISPSGVTAGSAGLTITVTGTGFTRGAAVRWNGINRPTTFIDSTRITAVVQSADLAVTGRAEVTVFIPESGGLVSAPFNFTIGSNPRQVRVVSVGGRAGGTVSLPVELVAQGDEGAIGFSLSYDPLVLSSPQVVIGEGANGATLSVNTGSTARGQLGILVGLPAGRSLTAGTKQIVVVTFQVAGGVTTTTTRVDFGDQPVARELVDSQARRLAASFTGSAIGIGLGIEGDVSPRPLGDGTLTAADWVQTSRLIAGLDQLPNESEVMRADCAPRSTLGDGVLSLADWVQSARYVAQLDPTTAAGGPTAIRYYSAPTPEETALALENSASPTQIRLLAGTGGAWNVEIESQGRENAIAFSLRYDPQRWIVEKVELAPSLVGASLQINQLNAYRGYLGIMLAMPASRVLTVGRQEIVRLTLTARLANDTPSLARLNFDDFPIRRELVGALAESLAVDFAVQIGGGYATPAAIVSAASYGKNELPRGGIVSIFGSRLATGNSAAATLPLPYSLGGAQVEITDAKGVTLPAPLFYASSGQLNLLLPEGLAKGIATALITNDRNERSLATVEIVDIAPGLFTANGDGRGIAAGLVIHVDPNGAQRQSGTARLDSATGAFSAVPIDLSRDDQQVYLVLFGTGLRFRSQGSVVTVRIGSTSLPTIFTGSHSEFAGLDQINLLLPRSLRGLGEVNLSVVIDGRESPPVRISIR